MCLLLAPSSPLGFSWGPPGEESLGPLVFFLMMRSHSIAVYCITTTMRLMVLDWCLRARTALHCAKIKTSRCQNAAERIKSHTFSHHEFTIHESKLQWHHRLSVFRRGEKSVLLVPAPVIKQPSHLVFFLLSAWPTNDFHSFLANTSLFLLSVSFRASTYLYLICHRNVCRSFMLLLCPFSFLLVSCRAEFSQFFTVCAATMVCCCSQLKSKNANDRTNVFPTYAHFLGFFVFSESGQVHIRHTGLSNRTNTM